MGKCAFIFPGQGSQYVGMGRDIYEQHPAAAVVFDRAGRALGWDMAALCFEGPEEELKKTVNAQPAILTVSVACLAVLQELGIRPHVAAGHSLGEYTALVAAGSLDFDDAVRLVRLRGKYMQEAAPLGEGGMVAVIGLETGVIAEICSAVSRQGPGVVEAVNLNCPGQVVIAGDNGSLARAVELLKEKGARRCVPLPVSAPFHSSLMKPAGDRLAAVLAAADVRTPALPVVSNVTANYHGSGEEIKKLLVRQVYSPVRWEESVGLMVRDGVSLFVEVGPGKVLTGLVRKINKDVNVINVDDIVSLEKALATLREVS
ncbi:MAG: ACP S-malonyltransferase [Bacillota bacterium]